MSAINIQALARQLDDAARLHHEIDPLTTEHPFTLAQAYEIQDEAIKLRHGRGEKPIGIKLGFTSRAKMIQMGVDSLIWGRLTDSMLYEEGAEIELGDFIHPRCEPEVCFLTKRRIDRPISSVEAHSYLEGVAPAMEIIDSRYRNFKFSLEDVVADNCSSAGLVIGSLTRRFEDLRNLGVCVRINGRVVQSGSTGAILGDPIRSLVQASRLAAKAGMVLEAGSLVMAGAATAAEALPADAHVSSEISGLGRIEFFTKGAI